MIWCLVQLYLWGGGLYEYASLQKVKSILKNENILPNLNQSIHTQSYYSSYLQKLSHYFITILLFSIEIIENLHERLFE